MSGTAMGVVIGGGCFLAGALSGSWACVLWTRKERDYWRDEYIRCFMELKDFRYTQHEWRVVYESSTDSAMPDDEYREATGRLARSLAGLDP